MMKSATMKCWVLMTTALAVVACDPSTAGDLRAAEMTSTTVATTTTIRPTTTLTAASPTPATDMAPSTTTSSSSTTSTTIASTTTTTTVTTTTSSSTASLATTTTSQGRYAVDVPTSRPPQQPGSGDFFGSGCSPGTSSLPDGIWVGTIVGATATQVEFDLKCLSLPDEDDVAWITNANPALRMVPTDPRASVYRHIEGRYATAMPYELWYPDPQTVGPCPPNGCWDVWIYVNDGAITEIVQIRIN
ncbi:MAG: hypothetical protein R6W79_09840 [Acidimicrobiia bacterium]